MYWALAFKNVFRSRARSLVTISAIATGCAALIVTGGFIQAAVEDLRESYIQAFLGHIQVYKRGFSEHGVLRPFDYMIDRPEETARAAASLPGVARVAPRVELAGLLSGGDSTLPCLAQGVDPDRELSPLLTIEEGENLKTEDGPAILLGAGLAQALHARPGDSLVFLTTTRGGALNGMDMTVRGVFRSTSKAFDDRAVRVPLKTAQKLMRADQVQRLTVFLDDTTRTEPVKQALTRLLREKGMDVEIKGWDELDDADFVVKLVGYYRRLFSVFKIIIILVVILSVFNTMNMSVLERIGEIGTLMALGLKANEVLALFLTEGLILGGIGGVVGLMSGYGLASLLGHIGLPMGVPPASTVEWIARVRIVPGVFVFAFLQAVLTSIASSSYPAWRASRLEIAQALRHNV